MSKHKTATVPLGTAAGKIIAAEMRRQELGDSAVSALAERRGHRVKRTAVQKVRDGTTADPCLSTVLAILAALGRDLSWFNRELSTQASKT